MSRLKTAANGSFLCIAIALSLLALYDILDVHKEKLFTFMKLIVNTTRVLSFDELSNMTASDPIIVNYVKQNILERPALDKPYNLNIPQELDPSQFRFTSSFLIPWFFQNVTNGTFFEAGALDGEIFSSTLYLERLGWRGMIAEMTPLNQPLIRLKNRKAIFAPVCVSPRATPVKKKIVMAHVPGDILSRSGASVSEQEWPRLKWYFNKGPIRGYSATVECYPITTLLLAANLTSLDVLFLDLEGVELKVLKTVDWDAIQIKVIVLDTLHTAEGFDATKAFLEFHGYHHVNGKRGGECVVFIANYVYARVLESRV